MNAKLFCIGLALGGCLGDGWVYRPHSQDHQETQDGAPEASGDSGEATAETATDAPEDGDAGRVQRSCPDPMERGCGTVLIEGGTFTMGEVGANGAEPVQPNITVSTFRMDAYEVTVARFRRYWAAGHPVPTGPVVYPGGVVPWTGTVTEPSTGVWTSTAPGAAWHPIAGVNWYTAMAFCVWDGGRLPTEAEWEYAARGRAVAGLPAPRRYPWGNEEPSPTCDRAQWNRCAGEDGLYTRRVGSFAGTGGVWDLAGNVWEWVADTLSDYRGNQCWGDATRTDPFCTMGTGGELRGASFSTISSTLQRPASRYPFAPDDGNNGTGMRCVR